MSRTGFACPKCGSMDNEYIWGSTDIECNTCGVIWDPGDEMESGEYICPRCESDRISINEEAGEFYCNDCGLTGDIDHLED